MKILNHEISINRLTDLGYQYYLEYYNPKLTSFTLHLNLGFYDQGTINEIEDFIDELFNAGFKLKILLYFHERRFTDEDIFYIYQLKDILDEDYNLKLYLASRYKDDYSLDEYISFRNKIENVVKKYDDRYSPFEKLLGAYLYATRHIYQEHDDEDNNPDIGRDLISVVNSKYIVCEGYANLIKYFADAFNITCFNEHLFIDSYESAHANNLIYLKDDKYCIDGLYYLDASWGSLRSNYEYPEVLCYYLSPISDVRRIDKRLRIYDDKCLLYLDDELTNYYIFTSNRVYLSDSINNYTNLVDYFGLYFDLQHLQQSYLKDLQKVGKVNETVNKLKSELDKHPLAKKCLKSHKRIPLGADLYSIFVLLFINENELFNKKILELESLYLSKKRYYHVDYYELKGFNYDKDIANLGSAISLNQFMISYTMLKISTVSKLKAALKDQPIKHGEPIKVDTYLKAFNVLNENKIVYFSKEYQDLVFECSKKMAISVFKKDAKNAFCH